MVTGITGGKVVGADLSLTGTGLADSRGRCTRIGTTGISTMSIARSALAIEELAKRITRWMEDDGGPVALLVVESLDARRGKGNGGQAERAHLWYQVVGWAARRGVAVVQVHPTRVKRYATGHHDANKREMIATVAEWNVWQVGKDDNKADAATLCTIGRHLLGMHPDAVPLTEQRRAILADLDYTPAPAPVSAAVGAKKVTGVESLPLFEVTR